MIKNVLLYINVHVKNMKSYARHRFVPGMVGLAPNWVRLAPNGTNPGLCQISFQCIWRPCAKCTEIWSEKLRICPIWGQSDPLRNQTYHPWFIQPCWLFSHSTVQTKLYSRDVRFGIEIGSDCPQMGQIWDFLRSVLMSQIALKLI